MRFALMLGLLVACGDSTTNTETKAAATGDGANTENTTPASTVASDNKDGKPVKVVTTTEKEQQVPVSSGAGKTNTTDSTDNVNSEE